MQVLGTPGEPQHCHVGEGRPRVRVEAACVSIPLPFSFCGRIAQGRAEQAEQAEQAEPRRAAESGGSKEAALPECQQARPLAGPLGPWALGPRGTTGLTVGRVLRLPVLLNYAATASESDKERRDAFPDAARAAPPSRPGGGVRARRYATHVLCTWTSGLGERTAAAKRHLPRLQRDRRPTPATPATLPCEETGGNGQKHDVFGSVELEPVEAPAIAWDSGGRGTRRARDGDA